MFRIARKRGEGVVICAPGLAPLRLVVDSMRRGEVRFRFDGPSTYAIHRGELYDKPRAPDVPLVALSAEDAARVRDAARSVAPDGP